MVVPDVPNHVAERGAPRMDVFFRPTTCFDLLSQSPLKHALDFLAWCMMSNHVHLLIDTGKAPLSKTVAQQGEHMANERAIAVYDSLSREYHRAFQVFLDHTDQKGPVVFAT